MNKSDREPGKGKQTRDKIVVQAMHLAAREGFGTLSIGRLAIEMSMSKSGIFLHFGSKENLQVAIVDRAGDLFSQHVLLPPEDDGLKGIERLWTLCDLWLKFVEGRILPGNYFFTGALFHCAGQERAIPKRITEIVWRWLNALRKAIEEAQSLGEVDGAVNARQTALELNGLLLSAQWCHAMGEEDRTQVRSAILAKLASLATEKIPPSAFESVGAWRKYLENKHA